MTRDAGGARLRVWAWNPDLSNFSQTYEWVIALPGLEIISEGTPDGQCLVQSRRTAYAIKVIPQGTLYSLEWTVLDKG